MTRHSTTPALGTRLWRGALSVVVATTLAGGLTPAAAFAAGESDAETQEAAPPPVEQNEPVADTSTPALPASAGVASAMAAAFSARSLDGTGLTITGGIENTDYTVDAANQKIVFTSEKAMTISGTSQGYTLEVAAGVHATLVLDNVTIQFDRTADSQKVPLNIVTNLLDVGGSERETEATEGTQIENPTSLHLILADGSTNTLTAGYGAPAIRCGEGSRLVVDDATLNIDSDGNAITPSEGRIPYDCTLQNGQAVKQGDPLYLMDSAKPGKLICEGGSGGAGIGSGPHENSGYMEFNGGDIMAYAFGNNSSDDGQYNHTGAGIGGSIGGGGTLSVFNGGVVDAKGSYHGAGIGAGCTIRPYAWSNQHSLADREPIPGSILSRESDRNGGTGQPKCRDITVNGGNITSEGYIHGYAFGGACDSASNDGHKLVITGGNLTPINGSAPSMLLGATGMEIIVQGGSFYVPTFGGTVTDGRGHTLQMVTINLDGFEELKGAQLKNLTVTVDGAPLTDNDGNRYDYGMPYGVDAAGCVYFWLPSVVNGKPISQQTVSIGNFETSVLDPETGDRTDVPSDFDFVVPNPGTGSLAKRYVEIDIDSYVEDTPDLKGTLFKRYDGQPVGIAGNLADTIASFNVPAGEPQGKFLDSSATMTISSQRTHDKNGDETTDAIQTGATFSNVGDYDLIVESKQYSGDPSFSKSFWGHKLFLSAAITPADSKISVLNHVIDYDQTMTRAAKPVKGVTFTGHVMPRDVTGEAGEAPEATTCAAPDGTVQFYANGVAVGDPVEVVPAAGTTDSGYAYSVGTLVWDKTGVQIPRNPDGTIEITAKFNGGTNYLKSESHDDRTTEELEPDFPFGDTPQITVKPQNPDPTVPVPEIKPDEVAKPGEKDPDATNKDIVNTLHSTVDDSVSYPVRPNAAPLTPDGGLLDWAESRYEIPAGCEISSITVKNADGSPADAVDPSKPGNYQVSVVVRDTVTGNTTTLDVDYAMVNPPSVNIPTTPDGPKDVPSDAVAEEPNGGTVHATGHDTVSRPVKIGHTETPDSLKEWAASRFDIPENCTMSTPSISQNGKPLLAIDCSTPGTYEVSFVVTDERGNTTTVNIDYHVTTPPSVTIPGSENQPKPPTDPSDPSNPGGIEEGPGNGTVHTTLTDTLSRPAAPGEKDTPDSLKEWAEGRYDIPEDCEIVKPTIKDADGNPVDEIDRGKPGRYEVTVEVKDPYGNSTYVVVDYTVHAAPGITPTDPDKSDLVEKEPPVTDPDGTIHESWEDRKPVTVKPDPDNPTKPITKDDIKKEVEDRYDIPDGSEIEITITDPDGNPVDEIDPTRPGDYTVSVTITSPLGDTTTIEMHYVVEKADGAGSSNGGDDGTGNGDGNDSGNGDGKGDGSDGSDETTRLHRARLAQTGDESLLGLGALGTAAASLAAGALALLRRKRAGE